MERRLHRSGGVRRRTVKDPAIRRLIMATAAVMIAGLENLISAAASRQAHPATWTIYEPTNTGVPGDHVPSIAVDANGDKWLAKVRP
jgi:hypothetical protein